MLNALAQALTAARRRAIAVPAPVWRGGLLCAGALVLAACGGGHAKAPAATALLALPSIVLGPADLANAYHMQSQQYLDDDAHPANSPTKQYRRVLNRNDAASGAADVILVTVTDSGVESASDFIDSASDDDTGPPNLQDYIASVVIGATNVHATPDPDFPSSDDATVANQLTWQQDVNGVAETEFAYGVYVRQQGLLAFISVRAATTGGEPDGLRKQAEDVVKKQADKLKQGAASAQRTPIWRAPRGVGARLSFPYAEKDYVHAVLPYSQTFGLAKQRERFVFSLDPPGTPLPPHRGGQEGGTDSQATQPPRL